MISFALQLASLASLAFLRGHERHPWLFSCASGRPSHFSLSGQREVTKRKATPEPRPLDILVQRVRESGPGFSTAHPCAGENARTSCARPCGPIVPASPRLRGPTKERALQRAEARATATATATAIAHCAPPLPSSQPFDRLRTGRPAAELGSNLISLGHGAETSKRFLLGRCPACAEPVQGCNDGELIQTFA